MTSRKYSVPLSLAIRSIELKLHKLIHIPHHHHVAIQLHNPVILLERKGCELAPAVVEARVIGEIFMDGGKEVVDSLFGNFTNLESAMTFGGKRVGVESNERVFRAMLFERVIKGEEAGEVSCVCYKSCPYFMVLVVGYRLLGCRSYLSLSPGLEWCRDQLSPPCPCLFAYFPPSPQLCDKSL